MSERNPIIANDLLLWQSDGGLNSGLNVATSLDSAFSTGPVRKTALEAQANQTHHSDSALDEPRTSAGYPVYKGIFGPIGAENGWGRNNPPDNRVVNALGADTNTPYFGSIIVLSDELSRTTQGPNPVLSGPGWGPTATNVMQLYQREGAKVEVRLAVSVAKANAPVDAVYELAPGGGYDYNGGIDNFIANYGVGGPISVAFYLTQLVNEHPWIQNIMVGNEPNNQDASGWPGTCYKCIWCGATHLYAWPNRDDQRIYEAISEYYVQVLNSIPDSVKQRVTFWTPPMDPNGRVDGSTMHFYLRPMINEYKNVSYNVYPHPGADAQAGHLRNRTFDFTFNDPMKKRIDQDYHAQVPPDGPPLKSQITEFGWEPGAMDAEHCNYNQDTLWPAGKTGGCVSTDLMGHRFFEDDLSYFLLNQRHKASSVTVWIARGWADGRADGVNRAGTPTALKNWFAAYQHWNDR